MTSTQTDIERTIAWYESFVASVAGGYDMCVYEYTNDLCSRQKLEDLQRSTATAALWKRIDAADGTLRRLLRPTKACIYGEYSKAAFWFWGYPPNSPQLEEDLRAAGAID